MKLLMLNSEYPPLGGGQGNANQAILDELTENHPEIQTDLVTASSGKKRCKTTKNTRLFLLNIGKKEKNFLFQSAKDLMVYSVKALFFSISLIRQSIRKCNPYDVMIAWSGLPAGFIAMWLSHCFHIPYVVLLRGADVPFYDTRWAKLDRLFFRHISPYIWQKSLLTIANSQALRELAYHTSRKKEIQLLYNGINRVQYSPGNSVKIQPPQIIAVGRLNRIKGFDLLIRAVAGIKAPCRLVIIGDGPQKEELQNLSCALGIQENVFLAGRLNKEQLIPFYQESTIFCLPSYREGMSNALLEAISCGLPVVTTQTGGTAELVQGNGFSVPCGDSSALQEALETLLENPERRTQCVQRSLEIATDFSWNKITSHFLELLQKALDTKY